MRRLRGTADVTPAVARVLLDLAAELKLAIAADLACQHDILPGRTLAMVFEKPSLRTRVSFETGMSHLGGHALYLGPADIGLGTRESVADAARNLGRMTQGIMARVFRHATILELAEHSPAPVINGLCDREHPCQALADYLTIRECLGGEAGVRVAYVGDGNNVCHSLLHFGALLGAHVVAVCPEGYEPLPEVVEEARRAAAETGGSVAVTSSLERGLDGAQVVYTDVWASMGQESEADARRAIFAPYSVDARVMGLAAPGALFMHCLPAHRGEEVAAEVVDGPRSVVFQQAENRLHAQKAVLAVLLR
jgi:ornithine carbamoyltransferase